MTTKSVNSVLVAPNPPVFAEAKRAVRLQEILDELDLGQDDSVQLAVALMRKMNLEPAAQATL